MLEDSDTESDTSSISPSVYESLLLTSESSAAGSISLILIAETAQKGLHALMDIDVDRIKDVSLFFAPK